MSMNVLLAVNSAPMRELLALSLESADVDQFVTVTCGEEAINEFELGPFDLVLANWSLPNRSGLDLLKSIRDKGSETPVILISEKVDEEQVLEAVEAGVSEFLTKPFASESRVYLENILRSMSGQSLRVHRRPRMNVEYINPFLSSAVSVFESMLNCTMERGDPYLSESCRPEHEVSGIVKLTGNTHGTFVLSFTRKAALGVLIPIMAQHPTEIDEDVIDVIGELTNIIVGHAQAQFEETGLTMTPPEIKVGRSHVIHFPEGVQPICIPFECRWGRVTVQFGVVEDDAELTAASA